MKLREHYADNKKKHDLRRGQKCQRHDALRIYDITVMLHSAQYTLSQKINGKSNEILFLYHKSVMCLCLSISEKNAHKCG